MERDSIYAAMREQRMKMIRRSLTAKEQVLEDLYILANHMYTNGDCSGAEWLDIVSNVIGYIEFEIPDNVEE